MPQFQTIAIERAYNTLFVLGTTDPRFIDGAMHKLLDVVENKTPGVEQARNLLFRARKAGKDRSKRVKARFAELMTATVVVDLAARRAKQARQKDNQRARSAESARQRNSGKKSA